MLGRIKYTATRFKLEQLEKNFSDKLVTIDNDMSSRRQKLQDVENSTIATARIMDTHLTQLMGEAKSFRESMNKRVNVYDLLLLDLLEGVFLFLVLNYFLLIFSGAQASVEVSICMFCEGESIDIYERGKALLMQVNWLLGYRGAASEQIEMSSQYLALPTVSNMRAIQVS